MPPRNSSQLFHNELYSSLFLIAIEIHPGVTDYDNRKRIEPTKTFSKPNPRKDLPLSPGKVPMVGNPGRLS